MTTTTKKIDIKTQDGVADAVAICPDGAGPFPAVLHFTDAFGIRPAAVAMAERLAAKGYFVLFPNVLYRAGNFAPFNPKTVWTDNAERERIMGVMKTLDPEGAGRDATAFLDALKADSRAIADKVGIVGYCMGGRLGFRMAGSHADRVGAVASIHGGSLAADAPDSPHHAAEKMRASLYFGVADNDQSCPPAQQALLASTLGGLHLNYQIELYAGAAHGFAVPDVPAYNEAAAERHWRRVFDLFETLPRARA